MRKTTNFNGIYIPAALARNLTQLGYTNWQQVGRAFTLAPGALLGGPIGPSSAQLIAQILVAKGLFTPQAQAHFNARQARIAKRYRITVTAPLGSPAPAPVAPARFALYGLTVKPAKPYGGFNP